MVLVEESSLCGRERGQLTADLFITNQLFDWLEVVPARCLIGQPKPASYLIGW